MCLRKPIQRFPVGCCVVVDVCAYQSLFHIKRKEATHKDASPLFLMFIAMI